MDSVSVPVTIIWFAAPDTDRTTEQVDAESRRPVLSIAASQRTPDSRLVADDHAGLCASPIVVLAITISSLTPSSTRELGNCDVMFVITSSGVEKMFCTLVEMFWMLDGICSGTSCPLLSSVAQPDADPGDGPVVTDIMSPVVLLNVIPIILENDIPATGGNVRDST